MEVDKDEQAILDKALDEWLKAGMLTTDKAKELKQSINTRQAERQQVAQYFLYIALFCTLPAFGAIFLNEKLLEKVKRYFSLNDLIVAVATAAIAAVWLWYIRRKRHAMSPTAYEVYMVLGGLSALTSIVYLCKDLGIDKTRTAYLDMSLPVLIIISVLCRSKALWIAALITAAGWFGAWSSSLSERNLFLGMNYPVRFTVFGFLMLGLAWLQLWLKQLLFARRITYTASLIIIFTGLWGVSIFGNYGNLEDWQQVRQIHVLAYSIVFALASVISFILGLRYRDDLARDFGVLFLLINLYTRYFEYFWDTMNKGIFFLVLAVAFGATGWLLERSANKQKKPAAEK